MKKNPFSVLGVPDTASDEEIRNAYRELARKYSDLSDDGKMQEINDAYDQIVMLRGGLGGSSSSSSSRSSSYAGNMSDLSDIREIRGGDGIALPVCTAGNRKYTENCRPV